MRYVWWFGRGDKDNDGDDHENSLKFTTKLFGLNFPKNLERRRIAFSLEDIKSSDYNFFRLGDTNNLQWDLFTLIPYKRVI